VPRSTDSRRSFFSIVGGKLRTIPDQLVETIRIEYRIESESRGHILGSKPLSHYAGPIPVRYTIQHTTSTTIDMNVDLSSLWSSVPNGSTVEAQELGIPIAVRMLYVVGVRDDGGRAG
jgi:hypothetical protein